MLSFQKGPNVTVASSNALGGIFEALILRVDFGPICFSMGVRKMRAACGRGGSWAVAGCGWLCSDLLPVFG